MSAVTSAGGGVRRRKLLQAAAFLGGGWALAGRANGDLLWRHSGWPQDLSTPVEALDKLITPTRLFFVRSHFGPPALNRRRRFTVHGRKGELSFDVDDLSQFEETSVTSVLQCFGNGRGSQIPHAPGVQWDQGAMGQAKWTGVRLAQILERVGIPTEAKWVRLQGADDPPLPTTPPFVRGLPLEKAMDRSTLVAYRMNGEPLTLSHGAPCRIVAPAWVGGHWVKWLRSVHAQTAEPEGFFFTTGYRVLKTAIPVGTPVKPEDTAPATVFPVKSIIAHPSQGEVLRPGEVEVTGLAFSGEAPIRWVEVSVDGGATFTTAKLEGERGVGRAQLFRARASIRPGRSVVIARATDDAGNSQPETPPWNPGGYLWNGWHRIEVEARG